MGETPGTHPSPTLDTPPPDMPHGKPGLTRDRSLIYTAAFLRAMATGMMGVLLGIYLARLDFSPAAIGLVISSGLGGAAVAALLATLAGDGWGRRRMLLGIGLLSAGGGVVAALAADAPVMLAAAFLGMLNGQGRDRGASLILEQAMLPATSDDAGRTGVFAWYNLLQDIGHALGGLLALLPSAARVYGGAGDLASLRLAVAVYALLLLGATLPYLFLSRRVEAPAQRPVLQIAPESRRVLWKITALFGLDSLAGGFLGTALLSYFFYQSFAVDESVIALLFFAARLANAASHLGAAWLAKRIGLVNTMVFTHIPSSVLLASVAFAPSFPVAAALFLLRESLVEMDVPTRQSYVMAVVRPEERTFASGVTHLVRLGGWAAAPTLAGVLMQGVALAAPLFIGAGMKIAYDVLLWRAFREVKPPEERG